MMDAKLPADESVRKFFWLKPFVSAGPVIATFRTPYATMETSSPCVVAAVVPEVLLVTPVAKAELAVLSIGGFAGLENRKIPSPPRSPAIPVNVTAVVSPAPAIFEQILR